MFLVIPKDHNKRGAYGSYIKLSKSIGIKIHHESFNTKAQLLKSPMWIKANAEFRNLKEAKKRLRSAAPKALRIFPIFTEINDMVWNAERADYDHIRRKVWRTAIAMEHIDGTTDKRNRHISAASALLIKANIIHGDLHGYNILIRNTKAKNRSKIVVIDWDDRLITMV